MDNVPQVSEAYSVSWSVYLENFPNQAIDNSVAVHALLDPLLDEERYNIVLDGLPTEVYGLDTYPAAGLTFSRLQGDAIWDVIYQVAVLTGTAVLPQDGPVCVTDDSHREWFPQELIDEVGIRSIASGSDIARIVSDI